jgi:hypothetical protein
LLAPSKLEQGTKFDALNYNQHIEIFLMPKGFSKLGSVQKECLSALSALSVAKEPKF